MQLHLRKKLCLQDISYFSAKQQYPFSYSTNQSTTPTQRKTPDISPSSKGMMKKIVMKRIEEYKNDGQPKEKQNNNREVKELKQMRKSPKINNKSQKLFQKVMKERNLSPKILERFDQYERDKSIKKLKMKIDTYYKSTSKMPHPEEIVVTKHPKQYQQAEKMLYSLNFSKQKY